MFAGPPKIDDNDVLFKMIRIFKNLYYNFKQSYNYTFIENLNQSKYFNVVCDDPEPICDFIVKTLKRGATVCHAQGAFSGQDKYVIFTAMNPSQAVKLRNYVKANAPDAFILISNTSEIIGKGFHSI